MGRTIPAPAGGRSDCVRDACGAPRRPDTPFDTALFLPPDSRPMTPKEPVRHTTEIAGLPIHYREWPGDGKDRDLVLLLHGFLDHGGTFGPLVAAAAAKLARARVIAPDFRGHGRSGWVAPYDYYYFSDYIGDTVRLLRRFDYERLALVGHSMGGSVALMLAGAWPELVQALVLLEGLGPPHQEPAAAVAQLRVWVEQVDAVRSRPPRGMPSVAEAAKRLCTLNRRLDPSLAYDLAREGTQAAADGRVHWTFDPLHRTRTPVIFDATRAKAFYRAVRCPTLLVEGELGYSPPW